MRKSLLAFLVLLLGAPAWASPAREETINTLLAETRVEQSLTSTYAQLDQYLETSMVAGYKAGAKGQEPTEGQKHRLKTAASQMGQLIRQEMSWAAMRAIYVQIYKEALTEEEVQGLIELYRTPAGKAMIEKMPVIMQKSMRVVSEMIPALVQKLIPAMEKAVQDAQTAK